MASTCQCGNQSCSGIFGANVSVIVGSDDSMRFRFGVLFDCAFPLSDVAGARKRQMHWWNGIRWRSNLLRRIALLGSHNGVVELRFKTRTRALGVFPCDSVAISLQDPDGFLAALKAAE